MLTRVPRDPGIARRIVHLVPAFMRMSKTSLVADAVARIPLTGLDHTSRRVLAQTDVDGATNEIVRLRPLLEGRILPGGWSPPLRCTSYASTPTGWSPSSTPPTC